MAPSPKNETAKPKRAASTPKANTSKSLAGLVLAALDDAKAENTVAIDIAGKSSIADMLVVTSGRSNRHVSALADQLGKALRDGGFSKPRIEGLPHCDWVLVDAGDVIIHIFRPEVRAFYNLEKLWNPDGPNQDH